jgi:hypothetical protein
LLADAEAGAGLVHGASTDTGQDHLIALNVADPDGSFDTTEQTANLVVDPLDQSVQIKDRIYLLDGLVQQQERTNLLLV